jgi:two-component system OmpR family sensor kinase
MPVRERDRRRELRALRRRHRDSLRTIRALKEAVAARDTVIAVAGHELRNPMGAIVVNVTNILYRMRREDGIPEWISTRLAALEKQTTNFVRRATTLLDVSRLTTERFAVDRELVCLADIVRDIVAETAEEARRSGCEVSVEATDAAMGWWDRAALEQVALNLLSNAIKYGAGAPIDVRVTCDESHAALTVRDHGIGIAESDRERIFGRFERAVTKRERPGFGLGLWIVRQLVIAHGGEVLVESTPGVGSLFTATLPRAITEPTP